MYGCKGLVVILGADRRGLVDFDKEKQIKEITELFGSNDGIRIMSSRRWLDAGSV